MIIRFGPESGEPVHKGDRASGAGHDRGRRRLSQDGDPQRRSGARHEERQQGADTS